MRIAVAGSIIAWALLGYAAPVLAQPQPPAPRPAPPAAPPAAVPITPPVAAPLAPHPAAPVVLPAPAPLPVPISAPPVLAPPAPAPLPPPVMAPLPLLPLAPLPPPIVAAPPAPFDAPPAPVEDRSGVAKDGAPMAGWHNGLFYLRDANDNFRLYVGGRAQIDAYTYFGPGVGSSSLKNTILLRRIRPELSGEFLKHFSWSLAGDWGMTTVDNVDGTNQSAAAPPGKDPTSATAKYAAAESVTVKAAATDVFLNWGCDPLFNLQLGQFDAPMTLENRTSDKYLPFMERSLAVRAVGIPNNKEIGLMAWGEDTGKHVHYAGGLFLGDGQNRTNMDNNGDFIGRVFAHPLASTDLPVKNIQIGASLRAGVRDTHGVNYDYSAMSTQGNYTFWSPTYSGTKGKMHIIPAGSQTTVSGEIRIPISFVDLTSEVVYIKNGTREAVDGYQNTNTERFGDMHGTSYYIQLGVWPLGNRDINGKPGYENIPHVDFTKPDAVNPPHALQLLAKWEQVNLTYAGHSKQESAPDPKNVDGNIKVNAFSLGANYWYTKHIRLSVNYVANMFPGSAPSKATSDTLTNVWSSDQRAQAPANKLAAGTADDVARNSANLLHELLFRVAVAL